MTRDYPVFLESKLRQTREIRHRAAQKSGLPWEPLWLGEVWRDTLRVTMKMDRLSRGDMTAPTEAEVEAEALRLLALSAEALEAEMDAKRSRTMH